MKAVEGGLPSEQSHLLHLVHADEMNFARQLMEAKEIVQISN